MARSLKVHGWIDDKKLHGLIEKKPQLTSLDLGGCKKITDAGLACLQELAQLKELNLEHWKITDAGLTRIKQVVQLTSLNLTHCNITDARLACLKDLSKLTTLDLTHCNITDAGLAHLKDLSKLTTLDLSHCNKITDAGIAHAKKLTQLTKLNLWGCKQITDKGLAHIKMLPRLMSLKLALCNKITDAGLAHLKDLSKLTSLNLTHCNITDAGLARLKDLSKLTTLNLSHCNKITDAGIVHAKKLTQLTSVDLNGCGLITEDGRLFARLLTGDVDSDALTHADVKWKLPDGTSLLSVAVQKNRKKAIEALLKKGADVNAVDKKGRNCFAAVADEGTAATFIKCLVAAERVSVVLDSMGSSGSGKGVAAFLQPYIPELSEACAIHSAAACAHRFTDRLSGPAAIAEAAAAHTSHVKGNYPAARDQQRNELVAMAGDIKDATSALQILTKELTKELANATVSSAVELPPFLVGWVQEAEAQLIEWKRDATAAITVWQDVMGAEARREHRSMVEREAAITGLWNAQLRLDALFADIRGCFPHDEVLTAKQRHRKQRKDLASRIQKALQQLANAFTTIEQLCALSCGPTKQGCSEELQTLKALVEELKKMQKKKRSYVKSRNAELELINDEDHQSEIPELDAKIAALDTELQAKRQAVATAYKSLKAAVPQWFPEHAKEFTDAIGGSILPLFDPTATLADFDGIEETRTPGVFTCTQGGQRKVLKPFNDLAAAQRECDGLKDIRSPFVVALAKTLADGGSGKYFAVMPYYSGGHIDAWLRPRLLAPDGSGAEALLRVMAQVAEGVAAIHKADVVHCDLKWENVVMTSERDSATPKVIDLDVCVSLEQRTTKLFTAAATTRALTVGGTQGWVAPEILDGLQKGLLWSELQRIVDFPIDIYALGLMLSRRISGGDAATLPWSLPPQDVPLDGVSSATLRRLAGVKAPLEALANGMLSHDPTTRPSATEVATGLGEMLMTLTKETEQRQVARLAIVSCCVCFGDTTAGDSVACAGGHVYCHECLPDACQSWAAEPIAKHNAKGGALFCMHGGCGAALPEEAVVRLNPAAQSLLTRVAAQVAEYRALEEFKQRLV